MIYNWYFLSSEPLEFFGFTGRRRRDFDLSDGIDSLVTANITSEITVPTASVYDTEGILMFDNLEEVFRDEKAHLDELIKELAWNDVMHDPTSHIDEQLADIFQFPTREEFELHSQVGNENRNQLYMTVPLTLQKCSLSCIKGMALLNKM